jgi:hypothetical protein
MNAGFGEEVAVAPRDLQYVLATVADDSTELLPRVREAVGILQERARQQYGGEVVLLPAEPLWRVVRYADPGAVYGLDLDADGSLEDPRLVGFLEVHSALLTQAPRTAAALDIVTTAEVTLAITAAHIAEER